MDSMEIHPIKIFLMDGYPVHQNLVGWRSIDQKVDWMDDGLDGLDGYPFWVHPLGALLTPAQVIGRLL